jgi:hypothetical protein
MKKVMLGMLVVALCASCGSSKKMAAKSSAPYQRTEIEIPCVKEGQGDAEYYRATGTATSINQQGARRAALQSAKSMIYEMLGGFIQGLSTDYSRNVTGDARANKVQGIIEGEFANLVEKKLNDADITCEKGFMLNDGNFEYWISIAISKKEIIDDLVTTLDENEELEILFNRDQFRKFAEDRMKQMQEAKK